MRKKKYYKTLKRYEELVIEKTFNNSFVNTEEYENVKKRLLDSIEKFCLIIRNEVTFEVGRLLRAGYRPELVEMKLKAKYKDIWDRLGNLKEKLVNNESININDYDKTYYKTKIFLL